VALREPVLLDFMSGIVSEPPAGDLFASLPCGDSPLALVERATLELSGL
jgi:hypothetical protein